MVKLKASAPISVNLKALRDRSSEDNGTIEDTLTPHLEPRTGKPKV